MATDSVLAPKGALFLFNSEITDLKESKCKICIEGSLIQLI